MNRIRQWPTALLSLAAFAAAAVAQNSAPGTQGVPQATRAADPAMREDVEILRRLLGNAFAAAYGLPGHGPQPSDLGLGIYNFDLNERNFSLNAAPAGWISNAVPSNIEGAYLKDYGVVYTATLPPPPRNPLLGGTIGVVVKTPVSDWERTRKELRGEKVEAEGPPVNGPPPLSEVILKVLAENGRHVAGLAEGERITVVVTFRDDAANRTNDPFTVQTWQNLSANHYPHQSGPGPAGSMPGGSFPPGMTLPAGSTSPGGSGPGGPSPPGGSLSPRGAYPGTMTPGGSFPQPGGTLPPAPGGVMPLLRTAQETPEWLAAVRDEVSLGDLHMKQGKTPEAFAAYMKAADQLHDVFGGADKAKQISAYLTAVDLCNKLAAAYVRTGDAEKAGKMLNEAADLAKQAKDLTGAVATANPTPSAPALPAKLVVTASNKLLEDVGAGKMTFEEFCKAAGVEYDGGPTSRTPQPVTTTGDSSNK